jgi:hypothetical protein
MTNTNCLENIKCPACGNEESLRIAASTIATVTDDGMEDYSDMEWGDNSYAECPKCHRNGALKDFRGRNGLEAEEEAIAMTITEHRPGPWVYTLDASGICGIHGGDNAKVPVRIGEVTADTQAQAEANARLIVAAPAQAIILTLAQLGLMTLAEGEAEFDGVMYWFDAGQADWCVGVVNAIGWDAARAAISEATPS